MNKEQIEKLNELLRWIRASDSVYAEYADALSAMISEHSLSAQDEVLKPYGWLTGESTSHRNGILQDLTTNYEWAKEICDKNNAENRHFDPEWIDDVPVPLYATPSPSLAVRDVVKPGNGLTTDMERELFGDGEAGAGED